MAYTSSFLVKNQGVGQHFQHHIKVTADAYSGTVDTGFGYVDFIQHSLQSGTTSLGTRVFANLTGGKVASNGTVLISGAANGDVLYLGKRLGYVFDKLNVNTYSVVKDINGFREMVSNARTDRITELYKEYQANIKAMFFIDQIILPPREDIGQMREVEVLERIKQTHTVFGPVVPRVNAEFLIPFMNRNIKMALRANILPELPEDLKETGFGLEIDVVFMNELATAQKMTTVTTIQQYMQQIAGMAQLDPTILDTINFDEIGVLEGRAMGVPETILRPEDEVQQIREARAKQQQAQAALEAANLAADTASKSSGQGQPQGGPPVA